MKQYRAILIDWDDTLGDWAASAERAQRALWNHYHLSEWCPSFEEWLPFYRAHNDDLWAAYSRNEITREYLHTDQFLYPICHYLGLERETAPRYLRDMAKRMADEYIELTNEYFCLVEGAEDMIHYLHRKYPIVIVSNGYCETQYLKLRKSGLDAYIAHCVFSEEAGVMKPDARIFDIAIERLQQQLPGLTRDEVVMIGDGYGSDIVGARAAGIDSIWFMRHEESAERMAEATYTVTNLAQVGDIL